MEVQQTVKEFTYDSAGRTIAVETSAGTTSLTYDYESRVTGITYPSQSTNSFTYNGLDTRVGMSDSGGSKTFLRDGVSVTSPVLSDGSATYTPAISERRSSTTTFSHAGIKNGDSQTNTSESATASIQYDAFGNVTSSSGTWQGPFAYGGPYGYQSDPDSGLNLLGHRYYDSSTGRFLTRDPVRDGRNWYGYCGNNPLKWADSEGNAAAALFPLAAGAALVDGPLPFGDIVAGGILLVAGIVAIAEAVTPDDVPFRGKPGDTVVGRKKSRRYGPDGYPQVDRDYDKTHDPPDHSHDWGRPPGGGQPTHRDRGSPRPPTEGDPPPPKNDPSSMAGIITPRGIIYQ